MILAHDHLADTEAFGSEGPADADVVGAATDDVVHKRAQEHAGTSPIYNRIQPALAQINSDPSAPRTNRSCRA